MKASVHVQFSSRLLKSCVCLSMCVFQIITNTKCVSSHFQFMIFEIFHKLNACTQNCVFVNGW